MARFAVRKEFVIGIIKMDVEDLGIVVPNKQFGPYTSIGAAISAAKQSRGAVWIPANYYGTESVPVNPGVPTFDMRGGAGSFTGSSSSFGAATVFVNSYGAVGDGRVILDATWNSGSPLITCPNNDCNFTSADNGKACFGTAGTQLQVALGTLTVVSAQSANCTSASSNTTTGRFVWGTDSSAAFVNATAALYAVPGCGSLRFGGGRYLFKPGIGSTNMPASCGIGSDFAGEQSGLMIRGEGVSSTFLTPLPTTDFSGCSSAGCFWNSATVQGTYYEDFTIDGVSQPFVSGVPTNLFTVPGAGGLKSVNLLNWMTTGGGCSPWAIQFGGATFGYAFATLGFGCGVVNALGQNILFTSAFGGQGLNVGGGSNNSVIDIQGTWGSSTNNGSAAINAGGIYSGYNTQIQTLGSGIAGVATFTGGQAHLHDCIGIGTNGDSSTAIGLLFNGTGTIDAQNCKIFGGSSGSLKSASAGNGTFLDLGNNTFAQTLANFSGTYTGPSVIKAACTGTATSSSTLGLYGTGPNVTATTCTSTTVGSGIVMQKAGTLVELIASASHAGVNASSGVVTVLKNGVPTSMTCTIGTGTSCTSGTTVSYAAGDLISLNFTTQGTEVLAGVQATIAVA